MQTGVELDVVGDPIGARFDAAARRLIQLAGDDGSGLWEDLLGPTKALRWRLLTQPQPAEFGASVQEASAEVAVRARDLRQAMGADAQRLLDDLASAAKAVAMAEPAVGAMLVDLIEETTAAQCVVIAASKPAATALSNWLGRRGYRVRTAAELTREQLLVEGGYAVGPPRFFPSSLVTAPTTETLSFLLPAWYADRKLPASPLATRAEGAVKVRSKEFRVGEVAQVDLAFSGESVDEESMLPHAAWIPPNTPPRVPSPDEVSARRVYLSGGYRMWLDDDGERIRAVDPSQPGGARVLNVDIEDVCPGVYLLLRDGQSERVALYEAALELMGPRRKAVEDSQAAWKAALKDRLDRLGRATVIRQLTGVGIRTLERVPAWTQPLLARPRSNQDFERLLTWLGIDVHPTYELATELRSVRIKASNKIGNQLETAVASADMVRLERNGYLRLVLDAEGFRGLIATRVVEVSPYPTNIPQYEARVLQLDRSARWRE